MDKRKLDRSKPSVPQERIKIRVLRKIPVFQGLEPVVGKVYDAINGTREDRPDIKGPRAEFCVIDVAGKKIVLRNAYRRKPEYEVIENG